MIEQLVLYLVSNALTMNDNPIVLTIQMALHFFLCSSEYLVQFWVLHYEDLVWT